MDLKTRLAYQFAQRRLKQIDRYAPQAEHIQRAQLKHILERASNTSIGKQYQLGKKTNYRAYQSLVPVQDYESIKSYIEQMIRGNKHILTPGDCRWFAKSSGTTNDKSKFIPLPYLYLHSCHYQGGKDALWIYLRNHPESKFFSTKGLILGGSHAPLSLNEHASAGDLSAILVQNMPLIGDMLRVPSRKTLLMSEWTSKMKAIVKEVIQAKVGSISGVPSWMLVLLKEVLKETGASNILEVWPELEVFFHGGISFDPYRSTYKELIPNKGMNYQEIYNASEGFFAIQDDPSDKGLLLMLDYGVFFEFVPIEELDESASPICSNTAPIPLWEVETGRNYAMLITTLGGLYRYLIGDTVQFTSTAPYKIVISGRTKHFINAFGEELMVSNTDKALTIACHRTGAEVMDYTVAPHFFFEAGKGRHDWVIEFSRAPESLDEFAQILDEELKQLNSDYEAKRYQNMTLQPLHITAVRPGLFHDWLNSQGKLGGQHKIPRLSNKRTYIDDLLRLINERP